jgi:hypothetical protein
LLRTPQAHCNHNFFLRIGHVAYLKFSCKLHL